MEFSNVSLFIIIDDPDINISLTKYRFRTFFQDRVSFINSIGITDPEIINKIHLNYRLIFLKDTATARWISESTYELLMSVILNPKCR